tara:strand:+ start:327 stop:908 length:582 start_codon:yes stop_codon:yes gene_type:complete
MSRLPTSGALSWNDIQNSFGGSSPIHINEYYRNSTYVNQSAINNNIPTSGAIDAADFHGSDGFSGTTGTFTNGDSGGKISSQGWDAGSYGSDLGVAFTTGAGIKVSVYKCGGLANVITTSSSTQSPCTATGGTSSNLKGRTLTLSGAQSYSATIGDLDSADDTPPTNYGSTGVLLSFANTTMAGSGTTTIAIS